MDLNLRFSETRRLVALLESIGPRKDFPVSRAKADLLRYHLISRYANPSEVQPSIVKIIEELPATLRSAAKRARLESKRKSYENYAAAVEEGFPKLLEAWRYWNKAKADLHLVKEHLLDSYLLINRLHSYYLEEKNPETAPLGGQTLFVRRSFNADDAREKDISAALDELFTVKILPPEELRRISDELYSLADAYETVEVRAEDLSSAAEAIALLRTGAEELSIMSLLEENWTTTK